MPASAKCLSKVSAPRQTENAIAANIFRIKAVEADAVIKELFSAFESIKAKIPAICPESESLQARNHYKG